VGSIVPYKHTVNANTFFGAPPGHIEFVDWSIDSEVVPDLGVGPDRDGERIMVIEHSFSLSFFFAGIRLDQESILHTYESDDGGLVKVFPNEGGEPVQEIFHRREMRNLDSLLQLFF
jgi:hypothetical protein